MLKFEIWIQIYLQFGLNCRFNNFKFKNQICQTPSLNNHSKQTSPLAIRSRYVLLMAKLKPTTTVAITRYITEGKSTNGIGKVNWLGFHGVQTGERSSMIRVSTLLILFHSSKRVVENTSLRKDLSVVLFVVPLLHLVISEIVMLIWKTSLKKRRKKLLFPPISEI